MGDFDLNVPDSIKFETPSDQPKVEKNKETDNPVVSLPEQTESIQNVSSTESTAPYTVTDATVPILIRPQVMTIDDASLSNQVAEKDREIATKILDNWIRDLRIQADLLHRKLTSPEYLAEQDALKNSQVLHTGLANGLTDYISAARGHSDYNVAATAASLIVGVTMIGQPITAQSIPHITSMEATSFEKMMEHSIAMVSNDFRAELGLIGGLFTARLTYQSTIDTTGGGVKAKGEAEKDLEFAKAYARNTLEVTQGQEIGHFVRGMISARMPHASEAVKAAKYQELLSTTKILLLASSMAMVYKLETGKITAQEFRGLLNGEIDLPEGDVRLPLAQSMRSELENLPADARNRLLQALDYFMNSDPKVELLVKPAKVFSSVLQNIPNSNVRG